jgi:hypothetical protein
LVSFHFELPAHFLYFVYSDLWNQPLSKGGGGWQNSKQMEIRPHSKTSFVLLVGDHGLKQQKNGTPESGGKVFSYIFILPPSLPPASQPASSPGSQSAFQTS